MRRKIDAVDGGVPRRSKTRVGALGRSAMRSRTGGGFKGPSLGYSTVAAPDVVVPADSNHVRAGDPSMSSPTTHLLATGPAACSLKDIKQAVAPFGSSGRDPRERKGEVISIPVRSSERSRLQFFGPPGEVVPNLWVGSMEHASPAAVKDLGFTSIVSIMRYTAFGGPPAYPRDIEFHNYPFCDNGTDCIPFAEIAKTIDKCLTRDLRVLVHCKQGISRSVSTIIAYLIIFRGLTFDEALAKTKTARPSAAPKFSAQLRDLASS
ncbi:MAP kinase phosphatase with leucine-rich repeats protein 3 [Diplonema papillatum]|nr:MAP kinase phosphatase with leucine-rich repeats protein 3 [Diplonema papillatum]